jgi:hypothetical protein
MTIFTLVHKTNELYHTIMLTGLLGMELRAIRCQSVSNLTQRQSDACGKQKQYQISKKMRLL